LENWSGFGSGFDATGALANERGAWSSTSLEAVASGSYHPGAGWGASGNHLCRVGGRRRRRPLTRSASRSVGRSGSGDCLI